MLLCTILLTLHCIGMIRFKMHCIELNCNQLSLNELQNTHVPLKSIQTCVSLYELLFHYNADSREQQSPK